MNHLIRSLNAHCSKNKKLEGFIPIFNKIVIASDFYFYNTCIANKYNRRLLYDNKYYEIIEITWGINASTNIHDHSNKGCIFKLIDGRLKEELYTKQKIKINTKFIYPGKTSYIDNAIGLHKIINLDNSSKSFHIYPK